MHDIGNKTDIQTNGAEQKAQKKNPHRYTYVIQDKSTNTYIGEKVTSSTFGVEKMVNPYAEK